MKEIILILTTQNIDTKIHQIILESRVAYSIEYSRSL